MPQVSERAAAPLASASAISSAREVASRGSAYLLAVITLAGAVLRLLHLGAKSLWIDEPLTVAIARMPWPHFVSNWRHGEAAFQGVYFLLMRGWLHLGQTEFWIRLPSALFAIASIPVLYMVARALIGERAALVATLLFALNPTDVYYSQEARGYTMAILLVLASTWFFVCAVQEEREHDWILWVVFSVLSFYSQLLTCFVIVAQAASLFAFRRDTKRWRPMLLHALLIVVLCAPGLVFVLRAQAGGLPQSDWPRATPKQWLHLAMFLGGSGEKVVLFAILWVAAVRTIWRATPSQAPTRSFLAWSAFDLLGNPACDPAGAVFALQPSVRAALHDLLPAGDNHAGGSGSGRIAEMEFGDVAGRGVVPEFNRQCLHGLSQAARGLAQRNGGFVGVRLKRRRSPGVSSLRSHRFRLLLRLARQQCAASPRLRPVLRFRRGSTNPASRGRARPARLSSHLGIVARSHFRQRYVAGLFCRRGQAVTVAIRRSQEVQISGAHDAGVQPVKERVLRLRDSVPSLKGLGSCSRYTQGLRFPPRFAQRRRESGAPGSLRPGLTAVPLRGLSFVGHPPPRRNEGGSDSKSEAGLLWLFLRTPLQL